MVFKKIGRRFNGVYFLAFCVLCASLICSCDVKIEDVWLPYIFDNKSSYPIQITLFMPYRVEVSSEVEVEVQVEVDGEMQTQTQTKTQTTTQTFTTPFLVSGLAVQKVSVRSDGNVNFQWTTDSGENNSKVHCVTNGPRATFTNR